MLSYFWPSTPKATDITVSVAESVTAGALSNSLCSEPGASAYFRGGVIAYSVSSKKDVLKIDTKYAEETNHANPFTTSEMARAVVKLFKSRIGLATTGYSLPITRPENKELHECALDVKIPYAYICLYDDVNNREIIIKEEFPNETGSISMQRASVQAKVALKATQMFNSYIESLKTTDDTTDIVGLP